MTTGIVKVMAGICGMNTEIRAKTDNRSKSKLITIEIESDCKDIEKLAEELKTVSPFEEIGFSGKGPKTLQIAAKHCKHAACPVPSGIIKAIEVASGLALPKDPVIQVSKEKTDNS
jgi:hypothetical protein